MPCNHKFKNDLELKRLDFEPETLIVGTFHPEWPVDDTAGWFYGRTGHSYMWDVLPRLYGEPSLLKATPAEWKQFCHDKRIAFTDLISAIDDAMPDNKAHQKMMAGFSDNAFIHNFDDLEYVNIVQLLRDHPTIKNVYLTRSVTEAFWRHLWNPTAHYCSQHHIHERRLLTPSDAGAGYQYEEYNHEHPEHPMPSISDYLLMRWKEEWAVL